MEYKNLEEAIKFLENRGKTVIKCDGKCDITNHGYYPDAVAYDEYGRLVAIIVDDSKDTNASRVLALTSLAARDSRILIVLIKAPKKSSTIKRYNTHNFDLDI